MPRKREKGDGLNFPCLEENMSKKIALLTPHCPINIDSGPNCKCCTDLHGAYFLLAKKIARWMHRMRITNISTLIKKNCSTFIFYKKYS